MDGPARARATLCPAWPRPEGHLGPLAPARALLASLKIPIENLDIHKIKAEENRNCFLENIKLNDMIILMYFHKKLQSMFFKAVVNIDKTMSSQKN